MSFLITVGLFSSQDHQSLISRPPLPEGGAIQDVPVSAASEAPEAEDSQDGDEGEDLVDVTSSIALLMTHKYRGSQQSSREVKPEFIDSTQGEPKNICKP
jgi:hypothetical protein